MAWQLRRPRASLKMASEWALQQFFIKPERGPEWRCPKVQFRSLLFALSFFFLIARLKNAYQTCRLEIQNSPSCLRYNGLQNSQCAICKCNFSTKEARIKYAGVRREDPWSNNCACKKQFWNRSLYTNQIWVRSTVGWGCLKETKDSFRLDKSYSSSI